ncbi:Protein C35D10.10 [Aphelenchoides avenae]|nr:Protein C35D10.10 [Aphelenchus avenae]
MFAKLANSFLFFRAKPIFGIVYSLIAVLCAVLLPEPVYKEADSIIYFRGDEFQAELDKDPSTVWVVAFFTTWSAECRYLVPVFSKLSEKYSLSNLKFAKLDVGKYPNAAVKFLINTHPTSKQLPSIAIFKNGKQVDRRPLIGSNRRAIPFVFSEENCIREFDLNNLYTECKNSGRKRKNQGTDDKEHEE